MSFGNSLTAEQVAAAAAKSSLYLEAHPGSGKTTVAATRFGVQRFDHTQPTDRRAVVAISFTRSATRELQSRVRRFWGSTALEFPHRIVTVDTIVSELLHYLLGCDAALWPSGHKQLTVLDTWSAMHKQEFVTLVPELRVADNRVEVSYMVRSARSSQISLAQFRKAINEGTCTHEDVRAVLGKLIETDEGVRQILIERLRSTTRALIVDEVFDGNELDLNLVLLADAAGVRVTVIGDPWQALYGFRGARPDAVPALVQQLALPTLPLSASFRWKTDEQRDLAAALRARKAVTLPPGAVSDVDVVLACQWKPMWESLPGVLPLAFSGARGTFPEAAATLLLDRLTQASFGVAATNIADAAALLGFGETTPEKTSRTLAEGLDAVLEALTEDPSRDALKAAYGHLQGLIHATGGAQLPDCHWQYLIRLRWLQQRLGTGTQLVMGLTAHQSKGREWDSVGLFLNDTERAHLAGGLDPDNERHRQIYVACTRARHLTVLLS